MNFEKLKEHYTFLIVQWLDSNKYEVSDHIIDIIRIVLLNRDGIMSDPGSGVKAFMTNNLFDFFRYADADVCKNGKIFLLEYHKIDAYHADKLNNDNLVNTEL
jgi:hypothetical protein